MKIKKNVLFLVLFIMNPCNALDMGQALFNPEKSNNMNGCKLLAIGHLYSIQPYPELQDVLTHHIKENYNDIDGIVLLGDNTIHGTKEEWIAIANKLNSLNINIYFAPGNHDLRNQNAYNNYQEIVGYTSKTFDLGKCKISMLNSVNPHQLDFNDVEMIKGGGLDSASYELLSNLSNKDFNILFMHHSLHAIGLVHWNDNWNDELNRIYENEIKWRAEVQPIIKDKVKGVVIGDFCNRRISYMELENIPYVANSFSGDFNPEPTTDRRPLSYTIIEVKDEKINFEIGYLPIPLQSNWFKFDRDHRFDLFKKFYNDSYDRKKYTYP